LVNGLRVEDIAREIIPYGLLTLAMCLVVLLCRQVMTAAGVGPPLTLAVCVAVGIFVYAGSVIVVRPAALTDFMRILPKGRITSFLSRDAASFSKSST
jgi:hypothetical protein